MFEAFAFVLLVLDIPSHGSLETQGLTAVLEATDAMPKSANVMLVGKARIGAALVTVAVNGNVAAVTAAMDAGSKAVGNPGKLIAARVIARPHDGLLALLPKQAPAVRRWQKCFLSPES